MTTVLHFSSASDTAGAANPRREGRREVLVFVGFWLLGLINNSAYVIMIAGANEVAASAVGLVYFCAIFPTLLVKLTAPYWFHRVDYSVRFWAAALLMTASFCIVALSSNMGAQLLGVALVAVQGGLGEASGLGLCALHPSQLSLTAWSSGTGFAGIMGYAWVAVLHVYLRLSFTATLLLATVLPGLWLVVFHHLMALSRPPTSSSTQMRYASLPLAADDDGTEALLRPGSSSTSSQVKSAELQLSPSTSPPPDGQSQEQPSDSRPRPQDLQTLHSSTHQGQQTHLASRRGSRQAAGHQQQETHQQVVVHLHTRCTGSNSSRCPSFVQQAESAGAAHSSRRDSRDTCGQQQCQLDPYSMTVMQRFKATVALYPYMVPLFVVYFAEYAMQSGTWTAIGFPVTSAEARHMFYLYSNWLYQAGVFISRSSGMLFQANRAVLWAMPALQCALLVFFSLDAIHHFWWNWGLLCLCFVAGLLGGAVYVNSLTLLSREVEPPLLEMSLSAACVADSMGIAAADLTAILIQGCLFKLQGLTGAAFKCGA